MKSRYLKTSLEDGKKIENELKVKIRPFQGKAGNRCAIEAAKIEMGRLLEVLRGLK